MDFSNFNFDSLDQNALNKTLAQLTPQLPGNAGEVFTEDYMAYQQPINLASTSYQDASIIPSDSQGQTDPPPMLVSFHRDFTHGASDNPFYNIEPWSGISPSLEQASSSDNTISQASALPAPHSVFVPQPSSCNWENCPQNDFVFPSDVELKVHLGSHAISVTRSWSGPSRCNWSGCNSKAVFKILSSLERHLENIHVAPLVCTISTCSFKKPFRNNHDLQRHVLQKHSSKQNFRCPFKGCELLGISFARKDKWLQHIQDLQHENERFCPVFHCDKEARGNLKGFQTGKEMSNHIFDQHVRNTTDSRVFECGSGGCIAHDSGVKLSESQMKSHLRRDHGMSQTALDSIGKFDTSENNIVGLDETLNLFPWSDCGLCVQPITPTSSSDHQAQLAITNDHKPPDASNLEGWSPMTARYRHQRRLEKFIICCECFSFGSLITLGENPRIGMYCTGGGCYPPHPYCRNCRIDVEVVAPDNY